MSFVEILEHSRFISLQEQFPAFHCNSSFHYRCTAGFSLQSGLAANVSVNLQKLIFLDFKKTIPIKKSSAFRAGEKLF